MYNDCVNIDSTHMVVGLDGYNETASVTIPRGDYSAMSIANMIVLGFNTIDGNRVIAKQENGVKINITPQSNDDPSLKIISNDNPYFPLTPGTSREFSLTFHLNW